MKVEVLEGRLVRATANSAGFDVASTEQVVIPVGAIRLVPTGIRTRMTGCYALLRDRSGLAAKYGVTVRAGVIDGDYGLEWKVVLRNEGQSPFVVEKGDRIAQALLLPLLDVEIVGEGVELREDVRQSGFGSTGA